MSRRGRCGVTLVELLVVLTILGVMTSIAYPSVAAGLDSLRLRAAASEVANWMTAAGNFAERRQVVVELRLRAQEARMVAPGLDRRYSLPAGLMLETEAPERVLFFDPAGYPPAVTITIRSRAGHARRVRLDPISGLAEVLGS